MSDNRPTPGLFIQRTGTRQYYGENDRGATINIGKGPGQWSPGDLMKLALLGCNALSADSRLAKSLGDDFTMGAGVAAQFNEEENRYESFTVELLPDFGDLEDDEAADLIRRALRAIDRQCTVGRTIDHVVPHDVEIRKGE